MNLEPISLLLFASLVSAADLVGEATLIDSGKAVYTERHQITTGNDGRNRRIRSEYTRPSGEVFATKVTDFSKNPLLPDVVFEDRRFGLKEELILEDKGKTLLIRRNQTGAKTEETRLQTRPDMVAGQGFDNFLKIHFDDLQSKERPISFVVPPKMDFFRFDAIALPTESERVRFRLRASSFLLRLFADSIEVEYDRDTRRLLTYRGLSNLDSDDGKAQSVLIRYKTDRP